MDWDRVIERNSEALRRILAMLVAMAGLAEGGRKTLPRHLRNAVLRLLRPAESAARRLVVIAARDIVITLPPPRPRQPQPTLEAWHAALRSLGIAVVMSGADIARAAAGKRAAARRAARPRMFALPLIDPLRLPRFRRRTVPPHRAPRILSLDGAPPHRLPPPPSPNDLLDATRLGLRFQALASVLDDLPGQALRLARWKARRARARAEGRMGRISPLKPGRAPGSQRRSTHEVHEVLKDMQYFARRALEQPDTS